MISHEPLPLSEATAYGIWSQLRHQMIDVPSYALASDPLSKSERKLYDILTQRFMYEASVVSITMEDKKP